VNALRSFLEAREIWDVPLAASLLAGALLGFLGVYVVLRRIVFVSAALTQISTLGLVGTLLAEEWWHIETEHASEQITVAMACSAAGALVLAALRPRRIPAEATVGAAWVVASSLVVLGASFLVHAAHDLGGLVFGNAVAVPRLDLWILLAVTLAFALVHTLFEKEIRFTSFDPETARASGVDVRTWDAVLFLMIGLAIPASARALGALPVFAFLTLPASAALLLGLRLRAALVAATVIGVVAAGAGYVVSWMLEIPTGATMVALAGVFLLPGLVLRRRW
jgi:zinc transport system permease protein